MVIQDKCTIVIITFNRYKYLERLLSFYMEYSFPFPVIVLDGSTDTDITANLNRLLSSDRVTHRNFPPEVSLSKRISLGLMEVKTEFCTIGADDDFLIPEGIAKCVSFLENASDYVIAQGFMVQHWLGRDRQGCSRFLWGPLYEGQTSVAVDKPEDRVRFAWGHFKASIFYAVHRTSVARLIWTETVDQRANHCLVEISAFILGFIYGKIKILPVFYCSRELSTYSWMSEDLKRELYSPKACAPLIDCWAGHLAKLSSMDISAARKVVKERFDLYVLRVMSKPSEGGSKKIWNVKFVQDWIWRWNKFRYLFILRMYFASDFDRVSRMVIQANIDPELLRRTRECYSRKCKD